MQKLLDSWFETKAAEWAPLFSACATCDAYDANAARHLPARPQIIDILKDLICLLTPGCMPRDTGARASGGRASREPVPRSRPGELLNPPPSPAAVARELYAASLAVCKYHCKKDPCEADGDCERSAKAAVESLFDGSRQLRELLRADVQAAYDGDPAASSPRKSPSSRAS